jgi:hypothetical protein
MKNLMKFSLFLFMAMAMAFVSCEDENVEEKPVCTGTLSFVNTSSNPYRVYINGKEEFSLTGEKSLLMNNMPTGSYSIRVLQVSGYLLFPTDKTYNGTLNCGTTLIVAFP